MVARVSSSRFVGRTAELAELEALLDRAGGRFAQLAFVTGESGMGKTRLVDELAARARAAGARVLIGECVELGDSELPYAPIVGALRPLVRGRDPALEALGPARAVLAELLPELGAAAEHPAPPATPYVTPQARLFEVLLALLDRLGEERPVVLVLEDLHWADRSTRDFLVLLSRALCRERLLVVGTYRSDELHRRHPLLPVVAELERSDRAVRIPLAPFTRDELAAQLEDILGAPPSSPLVDRLLARSEGNPLFAEELVAAGGDGRAELPPTLRDALMLRMEALPADAQELLRVVATARRIDHDALRAVSGLEGRVLRDALRAAVGQRILEADEDGRYAFRHALLREAVVDDLLPGERTELHIALAETLEATGDEALAPLTEIAHHFSFAGDRPRALAASVRAAGAAERVHANGEAAALLERALELWEHVPDAAALAGADHVGLLQRAAAAHDLAGDHLRMRTLLRRALSEVDRDRDPRRAAALLERLGRAEWSLGRGPEALTTLDEALALLPAGTPTRERAAVLAAQGRGFMLAGRYDEGAARCREAIAIARAAGARDAEDTALNTLGVCLAGLGDVDGGVRALRASMALSREDGRLDDLSRGYVNLADVLFLAGHAGEARALARQGLDELAELHVCRWLRLSLSEIEFHLGDFDEAERLLERDDAPRAGVESVLWHVRAGEVALARGDHVRATRLLETARELAQRSLEPQWHGPIAALLAQAYRRERRWQDARAAVDLGLERVSPERTQDVGRLARIAAAGVATEADHAQFHRDRGRPEAAEEAVRHALRLLEVARAAGDGPAAAWIPKARAHLADAEAEALRAQGRPDPDAYERAAAAWDALERPYTAALARRRRAETLAARGERDEAARAAASARDAAARLGAVWLVEELDALARRARLRVVGEDEPARADEPSDALGLTPREREVLALLAQGRTNREIGAELFMAEKTASVHVSRILAKLDVRTRTEAAAIAHRLGLAA